MQRSLIILSRKAKARDHLVPVPFLGLGSGNASQSSLEIFVYDICFVFVSFGMCGTKHSTSEILESSSSCTRFLSFRCVGFQSKVAWARVLLALLFRLCNLLFLMSLDSGADVSARISMDTSDIPCMIH